MHCYNLRDGKNIILSLALKFFFEVVPETWLTTEDGEKKIFDETSKGHGGYWNVSLEDVFRIEGMSLDDRNHGTNGTDGFIDAPEKYRHGEWPIYR